MMRKLFVTMTVMWGVAFNAFAQELAFRENDGNKTETTENTAVVVKSNAAPEFRYTVYGEIPVRETTFEEEHFLGAAISPKWNTFIANYTHEYAVSVGLTNSGVELVKPAIYNAVERANKYVRKSVRKGLLSKSEAIRIMSHVLDCANVLCFEADTEAVEQAAKAAKGGEAAVALFNKIELQRM